MLKFQSWKTLQLPVNLDDYGFLVVLPEAGVCTMYTDVSFKCFYMGQFSDQFGNILDATEDMLVAVVEIQHD